MKYRIELGIKNMEKKRGENALSLQIPEGVPVHEQ